MGRSGPVPEYSSIMVWFRSSSCEQRYILNRAEQARARQEYRKQVRRGARSPGRASQRRPLGACCNPLRQPVARHRLGEVRHRSGAGDHRRQEGGERISSADCGRRECSRVPDAARGVSRKRWKAPLRNSFMHSLFAKGRLLYTHDETIADLCAGLHEIGERDTQLQLLAAATHALAADRQGPQMVRHARRPGLHAHSGFCTRRRRWRVSR